MFIVTEYAALKRQEIIHLKMPSAEVVCCKYLPNITEYLSKQANSVDPEQTAPIGADWSGSTLFGIKSSLTFQQTRKADNFCCDLCIKGKKLKISKLKISYQRGE